MRREERLDETEEALRTAVEGALAGAWTALPGIVAGVDLDAQTLTVQPAVQGVVRSPGGAEKLVDLPLLIHVPIVWPRAGGFALTFPVAEGDEVLVVFGSRAIDSWWQSGGVGAPVEARTHDLSDGFAVLAPTSQPRRLEGVSAANVQLRDEAGSTFLEIEPGGKVRLVAVTEFKVEAPAIKLIGAVTIEGALTQTGGEATLTDAAIHVSTHKHTGVQTGGGVSGAPQAGS